jgi:hypothetical protein
VWQTNQENAMQTMDPPACARRESVEFWARQFAGRWYRGQGHLANDFRRFVSAHRVPADAHEDVCDRAQELLLGIAEGAQAA